MVPKVEPTLISIARRCARSSGSRRWVSCSVAVTLRPISSAICCSSCWSSRPKRLTPAALITQLSPPEFCAAATSASRPARVPISACTSWICCGKRLNSGCKASRWRPANSRWAPSLARAYTSAWPIPPLAPVIRARQSVGCMASLLSGKRQAAEHVAVQTVDDLGGVHHGGLVIVVVQAVHQLLEELDVLQIQAAVGVEVAEGLARQLQRVLDDAGGLGGQGDAGAFEDVDHAKEAHRVVPGDAVVDVGHHQLGGYVRGAMAHRFLVGTAGGDVVEHPLLVAGFFLDVLGDGFAQPFQALRQTRATGHQ